jgi:hypothetical protein
MPPPVARHAPQACEAKAPMQALIWLPVDHTALEAIYALLRRRDVLTSGYEHLGVDEYNPATYLQDQLLEETSFCFRYDRNVLCPWWRWCRASH